MVKGKEQANNNIRKAFDKNENEALQIEYRYFGTSYSGSWSYFNYTNKIVLKKGNEGI